MHAQELLKEFRTKHASKEGIWALQVQERSKEGILSQAQLMPSRIQGKPWTSPTMPPLKRSYSHIVKINPISRTHDPGKGHVTKSHDLSHDLQALKASHDTTCDPGKRSGDLPRDWSSTWSLDYVNFRCAMHPLINTWKTVGTINEVMRINKITRLRRITVAQSTVGEIPRTDQWVPYRLAGPKVGPPVTHRNTYPKPSTQTTLY
jgi:hypothetical protein